MEASTYQNIFETKGIEYIVVIVFFLILIPFWIVLNRQVKINRLIHRTLGTLTAGSLRIPQGLFFSRFHTWTHLGKSGIASIGPDDFLLHITGPVKFIPLKNPGEKIKNGEILADVEHDGKLLRILSPISGEIADLNQDLVESPDLMTIDPYMKGWMFKITPSDWIADTRGCYLANEATRWSEQEVDRFKGFLAASMAKFSPDTGGIILQDGGELVDQPLASLPGEVWNDFQKEFLD